jgi:anti-anti-sigma factor
VQPEHLFKARTISVDGGSLILLRGDVDAYTAPVLREALAAELDGGHLALDCGGLTFIDGAGLKVLEWAAAAIAPRTIEVRNAPPVLRQLAGILGVRALEFVPQARTDDADGGAADEYQQRRASNS